MNKGITHYIFMFLFFHDPDGSSHDQEGMNDDDFAIFTRGLTFFTNIKFPILNQYTP